MVGGMGEAVQLEIFGVSAVEPPWRDNKDAMEYPFLALQKKRTKPIEYSAKGNSYQHRFGSAVFYSDDLGLGPDYLRGLSPERRHRGRACSRRHEYDSYRMTACASLGARPAGKDYRELAQSIRRLRATLVITNIRR